MGHYENKKSDKHDKTDIPFFSCGNYHGNRDTCKSTHYLRADAIEQVVTLELRKMTKFLQDDEEAFAALLADKTNKLIGAAFLIHCPPQIPGLVSTLCCNPYNKGIPVYSPTHSGYTLGRYLS